MTTSPAQRSKLFAFFEHFSSSLSEDIFLSWSVNIKLIGTLIADMFEIIRFLKRFWPVFYSDVICRVSENSGRKKNLVNMNDEMKEKLFNSFARGSEAVVSFYFVSSWKETACEIPLPKSKIFSLHLKFDAKVFNWIRCDMRNHCFSYTQSILVAFTLIKECKRQVVIVVQL